VLTGKKTNLGAALMAVTQLLVALGMISPQVGDALTTLGGALATIGIGSKLQRMLDK